MGWLGDLFLGENSEEWYREQLRKLRDDERTLLNEQAKIILKARGLHLDNNKEYRDTTRKLEGVQRKIASLRRDMQHKGYKV